MNIIEDLGGKYISFHPSFVSFLFGKLYGLVRNQAIILALHIALLIYGVNSIFAQKSKLTLCTSLIVLIFQLDFGILRYTAVLAGCGRLQH